MDAHDDRKLAALMDAAQKGNAEAYRQVLRACVPLAATVARQHGVRPGSVDDVVQDVLITFHRALPTYDPARPFLPWLRAIAARRAIDTLRRQQRSFGREVFDPLAYMNHADSGPDAAESSSRKGDAGRLRAAITTLPPRQRHAIEQLGLQERTLEEVAQATGRSKGALKVNFHRALRSLRTRLGLPDV
jgi:RNA polymerase sigma-70 factor (ECF subfamily)